MLFSPVFPILFSICPKHTENHLYAEQRSDHILFWSQFLAICSNDPEWICQSALPDVCLGFLDPYLEVCKTDYDRFCVHTEAITCHIVTK